MNSVRELYRSYLENWPDTAGVRPTTTELAQVHESGAARPGTKDALALAMAIRAKGATQAQIRSVLGSVHRNKLAWVVERGYALRTPMGKVDGLMVYKLEIIPKSSTPSQVETENRVQA